MSSSRINTSQGHHVMTLIFVIVLGHISQLKPQVDI
jgi:hypothetical protein